jgi:O-antigen/teichoic acid export membrane protein
MVPFTIDLIQNVGLTILRVNNTYGFRARIYFLTAVLNIIATVLLVPQFGLIGAACSTAGAMVVGSGFVMNWFYWKRTGIDIPGFWKQICRIAVPAFVLFAIAYILNATILPVADSWLMLILYLAVYVACYVASCWLFAFNDYEKGLLRSMKDAIIHRS